MSGVPTFTRGDRLRKARGQTGMTTREFARALGVSQTTVTMLENDHVEPRRVVLLAWAEVTGVPVDWLEHGDADGV